MIGGRKEMGLFYKEASRASVCPASGGTSSF